MEEIKSLRRNQIVSAWLQRVTKKINLRRKRRAHDDDVELDESTTIATPLQSLQQQNFEIDSSPYLRQFLQFEQRQPYDQHIILLLQQLKRFHFFPNRKRRSIYEFSI